MLGPVSPPSPWVDTDGRLDTLTALLSRTFRPEQRAIVKATSFTSEIARRLIPPASTTLFLFATPAHYLENILAGENSDRKGVGSGKSVSVRVDLGGRRRI